ncbi:g8121 [Coccomyxa viridis]|uniref:G8121 protein n=1 Tax=Coccomyxa viridis TaxID=1274662 RepID=A0ABP1G260_9CHLO
MMAEGKKATCTCFVANLPFGVTEEQLREVFQDVGPVKSIRIVTDRDTGKQKGFAFLEFFDTQTAESAIRNLNEHDLNGRKLKVHFAANDMDSKIRQGKESGDSGQGRGGPPAPRPAARHPGRPPAQRDPGVIHPKTMGLEAARGAAYSMAAITDSKPAPAGSGEQISSTLGNLSVAELYEIMAQMKGLVQQNPPQARQVLVQNPQLTKALFQAQIMLGMVKNAPQVQAPPLQPAPAPAPHYAQPSPPVHHQPPPHYQPAPAPQAPHAPPHQQPPPGQPGPSYPQPQLHQPPYHQQPSPHHLPAAAQPVQAVPNGAYAPPYAPQGQIHPAPGPVQHNQPPGWPPQQPQQQPPPQQVQYNPAPQAQQPYAAPQPDLAYTQQPQEQMQAQPPPQQQLSVDAAQQQALLQQVMQLTPEQIAGLPADQQAQVLALQQHMRSQGQL